MSPGKHDIDCHFSASFFAAVVNFPLWRASAITQSGFTLEGASILQRYYKAVTHPPFRGVAATMLGMTWARGFIFYASDSGKAFLKGQGVSNILSTTLPPMVSSIFVQIVNMPLVRGTITIQNPKSPHETVRAALAHIYATKGINGLWHGTSAGLMKTVPKYITAVIIRDWCEDFLPTFGDSNDRNAQLFRSAVKSTAAGVAGAALTNPLDVIRNEMFKTDLSLTKTVSKLMKEEGIAFSLRGIAPNMTAVAIPIALTIFLTDVFKTVKYRSPMN